MGMCLGETPETEPYSVEVRSSHGEFVLRGEDVHDYVYNGAELPEHAIVVHEERRPSRCENPLLAEDLELYLDVVNVALAGAPTSRKRAFTKVCAELERARAAEVEADERWTSVGSVTFRLEDIPKLRAAFDQVEAYLAAQAGRR